MPDYFKALRDLTDEACEAAQALNSEQRRALGAVNWGDLGCAEVVRCIREDGSEFWQVWVEEVSPSSDLSTFVRDFLKRESPGVEVEVICDW